MCRYLYPTIKPEKCPKIFELSFGCKVDCEHKSVKSIMFETSYAGELSDTIAFHQPVTEVEAVEVVEDLLSRPVTEYDLEEHKTAEDFYHDDHYSVFHLISDFLTDGYHVKKLEHDGDGHYKMITDHS